MRAVGIALMTVVLATVLLVVLGFPAIAALLCPRCYGFRPIDHNIFTNEAPRDQQEMVLQMVQAGREKAVQFWGGLQANAPIFVCLSDECFNRVHGGRRRGMSWFDEAVFLSPRGSDPIIAAHELSEIELHHRIGFIKFVTDAIPVWFDEGVAIYVSDDSRYLKAIGSERRCVVRSDEKLPVSISEWNRKVPQDDQLYAKAACRVSDWIAAKDGPQAVQHLVARVAAGVSFAKAYQ